jgi:hypothetical protein
MTKEEVEEGMGLIVNICKEGEVRMSHSDIQSEYGYK